MSTRFVPAGSDPNVASIQSDDGWSKAIQEVENRKIVKPLDPGKQDDGKSLYDVLQANKNAKQEAFEEASKLRNQFRPLDDSEVEFLESVRESERMKENSVRQETSEQLELFRKQQAEIELAASDADDTPKDIEQEAKVIWKTSRKRRREKDDADQVTPKARKQSEGRSDLETLNSATDCEPEPSEKDRQPDMPLSTAPIPAIKDSNDVKPVGLGLVAYDSDDE